MTLPVTESLLQRLGWDDGWEAAFAEHGAAGLAPARVAVQHRGAYDLMHEHGEQRASAANRLVREEGLPAVGDWVGIDLHSNLIEALLPRRTSISRKEVWQATREQILAANVDVSFLVQALPLDFNPRRLERYLAMAWESGAQPVVLLTKTDLVDDVQPYLDRVEAVTLGSCPVHAVSARTGEGLDEFRAWLEPNRTAVLLGSSGVGKSTIVNRLLDRELLATGELRADGRGRHTTTRRELLLLPGGGLVLDTPGLRELQLWDGGGVDDAFAEIAELAGGCRFNDCSHSQEPGCAVLAALAAGTLPPERLASYRKLERELAALERKRDRTAAIEYRRRWRAIARANRQRRNA